MSAQPAASPSNSAQVVRDYLSAMERRDLAAANAMLAPGFWMLFPGNRRHDTLQQLVDSSKKRYRSANKTYDRFDVAPAEGGAEVVYCYGMLSGELLGGEAYSGIRFIDRFTVKDGRLVDQMVWNDMREILGDRLGQS